MALNIRGGSGNKGQAINIIVLNASDDNNLRTHNISELPKIKKELIKNHPIFDPLNIHDLSFYDGSYWVDGHELINFFDVRTDDSERKLTLDLNILRDAVTNTAFFDRRLIDYLQVAGLPYQKHIIFIILLPEPSNGSAPLTTRYTAGDPDPLSTDPDAPPIPFDFIIAQDGLGIETLIAQEIGFLIGLGSEAPFGNPEGLDRPDPNTLGALAPNLILHPPNGGWVYDPTIDMCASIVNKLSDIASLEAYNPNNPAPVSSTKPGRFTATLWEGGGGYSQGVYRTHSDCVMRRVLNDSQLPLRTANVDFCPACKVLLESTLKKSRRGPRIDQQKLWFDKINWGNATNGEDVANAFAGIPWEITTSPDAHARDYWTFKFTNNPNEGLRLTDLLHNDTQSSMPHHGHNAPHSGSQNQVAKEIRFRDARVVVETDGVQTCYWVDPVHLANDPDATFDETGESISLTAQIVSNSETFVYGKNGGLKNDLLWQHGLKRSVTYNLDNKVEVTVEQAIAFHGALNDFDPAGAVIAMNVFPQFAFTWKGLDGTSTVKSFHGCVWQDVNPKAEMTHSTDTASNTPSIPDAKVFTSWFCEINPYPNAAFFPNRLKHSTPSSFGTLETGLMNPLTFFAAGLFAYHFPQDMEIGDPLLVREHSLENPIVNTPNPNKVNTSPQAMEIVGVRHIQDSAYLRNRLYYWHGTVLPFVDETISVYRQYRSGQYDNIHNHGWMGWTLRPDTAETSPLYVPRIMAPVCGEACVHLHWRWLTGSYRQHNGLPHGSKATAIKYLGWGDDPKSARGNTENDNPMIPPNQRLRIAVTKPEYDRMTLTPCLYKTVLEDDAGSTNSTRDRNIHGIRPAIGSTRAATASPLSPHSRGLWYDVDVIDHIEESAPQILLENGWGIAVRHTLGGLTEKLLRDAAHNAASSFTWLGLGHNLTYGTNEEHFNAIDPNTLEYKRPFIEAMMVLYDDWRFYYNGVEQSPRGNHSVRALQPDTIAMEDV